MIPFTINTKDGLRLSAIIVSEHNYDPPLGVIQFHAGTVIRKEFYLDFAKYLSELSSCDVLLFDYRGVGSSRPKNLKGFEAGISHWGALDAPAVLEYIRYNYSGLPIHLVAHSMGGQILGLMNNWSYFDKIIMIASSSGNWNNFQSGYRKKIRFLGKYIFPTVLKLIGYGPASFGLGQDWPELVAREWMENSMRDSLMADYMDSKLPNTYYDEVNKNILAWFFSDDHMATPSTVINLQKSYPNSKVQTKMICPDQLEIPKIGHFGLFKNSLLKPLVAELAAIIKKSSQQ